MPVLNKILAPTSGEVPARANAEYLVKLVKRLHGELLVINILDDLTAPGSPREEEGKKALGYFTQAAKYHEVPIETRIVRGPVAKTIAEVAQRENVNLIVMGVSEGRTVAEWIVADLRNKSRIPVVVAPGGFTDIF